MKKKSSDHIETGTPNFNMWAIENLDSSEAGIIKELYEKLIHEVHKDSESLRTLVALRHLLIYIFSKRSRSDVNQIINMLSDERIFVDRAIVNSILANSQVVYEAMDDQAQSALREFYRNSVNKIF